MHRLAPILTVIVFISSLGSYPLGAQTLTPIEIIQTPAEEAVTTLYAVRSGIFRRLGLDAKVSFMNNGAASTAAVVSGTVQFGQNTVFTTVMANAHDLPVRIVAPSSVFTPSYPFGVVVKKDSPIQTAADLNGKTFGSPSLNAYSTLILQAWIDQNGGNSRTLKALEIPSSALPAALSSGRIDVATFAGPLLAQALDSPTERVLANPLISVVGRNAKFVLTDYFTTAAYAQANPRIVQAFARGILEANAYVNKHPAETAPLVAEILNVDVATVLQSERLQYRLANDPKDFQPTVDLMYKYKFIDKPIDARELYATAALGLR
jgi:NitT/TauT family transport system substrate-binding protein